MAHMWDSAHLLYVLLTTLLTIDSYTQAYIDNSLGTSKKEAAVRWTVTPFNSCTVACGGGKQTRSIQCVRDVQWRGRTIQAPVSDEICPSPPPTERRSCNTHPCTAKWVKGDWTECSVSCGIGSQTREVRCESTLWSSDRYQVSHSECGGAPPDTTRKCYIVDCPYGIPGEYAIKSENYSLIQFRRAKRLKLTVGGKVQLLRGQTVLVRCPVKDTDRDLVQWSKGYRLVRPFGRVRFTTKGNLKIKKGDPSTDAGVYTCVFGDQQAKIDVQFIEKDDPITKTYKSWIRKSSKHLKRKKQHEDHHNNVLRPPDQASTEDLRQQRDQSRNSTSQLSYVVGDWSSCSATCDAKGHRKRKVTCSHVTSKYVKIVPDENCDRIGLVKPITLQECSSGSDCAVWVPGKWTECRPRCGKSVGHKTRYLICKWKKSGLPAWTACDKRQKPEVRKICKPASCPPKCTNSSRFCSVAKLLNMCRYSSFQRKCCKTCHHSQSRRNTNSTT